MRFIRSSIFQKFWRKIVLIFLMGVVAAGIFILWRLATHNEGVVEPGELYRSAQLDPAELQKQISSYGIKTVINLRGENIDAAWYTQEIGLCEKLNVRHVDVRMSAQHLPPPAEVLILLNAYHEMPRPILLHCRSGADRTGLAAALYLIDQDGVSWTDAERQLSPSYGHFAIYPYFEMDEFLELYGDGSKKSLMSWTKEDYPSVYAEEAKETQWDEMLEPWESFFTGHS